MTFDLTPKQEAFAQAYVETGNACEAYRQAYSTKNMSQRALEVEASRLLQHPEVSLRLKDMQKASAEKHEITVDKLTQMTLDAYALAMKDDNAQTSAAVKAAEFLGKLHGLVIDKKEITGKDGAPLVPQLNVSLSIVK